MAGGVPIVIDGKIVGGIGVSRRDRSEPTTINRPAKLVIRRLPRHVANEIIRDVIISILVGAAAVLTCGLMILMWHLL